MIGGTGGTGGGGLILRFPLFFPPSGGNLNALFIVPVLVRFFPDGVVGSSSSSSSPSTDGKDGSGTGCGLFEDVELRAGIVGDAELGTDSSPPSRWIKASLPLVLVPTGGVLVLALLDGPPETLEREFDVLAAGRLACELEAEVMLGGDEGGSGWFCREIDCTRLWPCKSGGTELPR